MLYEINKQNKKSLKKLFIMKLLTGETIFSIDRDNGRIVEITGFSMKTRSFKWKYDGAKNSKTYWTVSAGETYAFKRYELFETSAKIIASKMR